MRSVGVVCECNPFHSGHKHLFERARASGADVIVCVMSGCFVQRGTAAIADPYSRATAVINGGADLVVELPFPYSSSSAEYFADAGVNILSRLGVDELWFGSECGSIDRLSSAARAVSSPSFLKRYGESNSDDVGTAQAYFESLSMSCEGEEGFSSNDILGISYLRALLLQESTMRPVTILREGSAYRTEEVETGAHPSATALRRLLLENGLDGACGSLLPETANALKAAQDSNMAMASLRYAERAVLSGLRMADPNVLSNLAELGGGLGNRLIECAKNATTLEELLEMAATKKYTMARLQRGILFAMTGVTREDLKAASTYTRMLAANSVGCAFLSEQRKQKTIPVITCNAKIPTDPCATRQEELHRRAISLYSLCLEKAIPAGTLLRKNPLILK